MSTFQEVNDASLIQLIGEAQRRVVFVAPGVHQAVAEALGQRLAEIDRLQVTVVIDPDEDVCRIGYGDAKGLELLSSYADRQSFVLMAQPGLRVGVLLVEMDTMPDRRQADRGRRSGRSRGGDLQGHRPPRGDQDRREGQGHDVKIPEHRHPEHLTDALRRVVDPPMKERIIRSFFFAVPA